VEINIKNNIDFLIGLLFTIIILDNTSNIYIIVYYVNSSVFENHHYISTPLDETLKRLDYIGLVRGINCIPKKLVAVACICVEKLRPKIAQAIPKEENRSLASPDWRENPPDFSSGDLEGKREQGP